MTSNAKIKFDKATCRAIFGHEAAENDDLDRLRKFYFKSASYEQLRSAGSLAILIGHKGIGKSALMTVSANEDRNNGQMAIVLRPDDIPSNRKGSDADLNEMIRGWKDDLLDIVQGKILDTFMLPVDENRNWLFKNWRAFVSDFAKTVKSRIEASADIHLESTQQAILDSFLKQKTIRIYVDDLDRGWNATRASVNRMSAMLNAMRDISRDYQNIQFVVSLRSDVYYLVRTSDESTDKLESSCYWFTWTNHEILAMLIKRIKTYFGLPCPSDRELIAMDQALLAADLTKVMTGRFNGRGQWENIPTHRMLMTLIRRRPRDLVKLCVRAAEAAEKNQHSLIESADFDEIFSRYSQDRLQDAINEYKSELPDIQALLENMKPTQAERKRKVRRYVFTMGELQNKVKNITERHKFYFFEQKRPASERERMQFMYKIGFITARRQLPTGMIVRHFFEEQNYVCSTFSDFGYDWEIHPAYRWALNPSDTNPWEWIDLLCDE